MPDLTNPELIETISTLEINGNSDVRFSVYKYKNDYYGDIRKYVNTDKYVGPTKKGIRLLNIHWKKIFDILNSLNGFNDSVEQDLCEIVISDARSVVVCISVFGREKYFQISNYYPESDKFGHGIAVNIKELDKFNKMLSNLISSLEGGIGPKPDIESEVTDSELKELFVSFISNPENYTKTSADIEKVQMMVLSSNKCDSQNDFFAALEIWSKEKSKHNCWM